MLRAVYTKAIWDNRRGWLGWLAAITAVATMYASFWPTIDTPQILDALDAYPEALLEALNMEDLTRPEGYLGSSVFGLLVPILVAVFAIAAGTRALATDEEAGTLDLVMAHPVSRTALALQRFGAVVTALIVTVAAVFAAVTALRGPAQFSEVGVGRIGAISLQLFLFGLFFAALAFAIGAFTGRRVPAIGGAAAVVVVGYLANAFLPQVERLEWTRHASPFHWYLGGDPLLNGVQWGGVGLLAGSAALVLVVGVIRFQRRDLGV
jgi:ABC-2 type transport system permease protein